MANPYQAKIDAIMRAVGDVMVAPSTPLREVIRSGRQSVVEDWQAYSETTTDEILRKIVLTVLEAAVDVPLDEPKVESNPMKH